jgi:hypothetical protein
MPELVHVGAIVICPHGGPVAIKSTNTRVHVGSQPVTIESDTYTVNTGCTFTVPGPKPQPCGWGKWIVPAARVKVGGKRVILKTSTGMCYFGPERSEQFPQGQPNVIMTQVRVRGS